MADQKRPRFRLELEPLKQELQPVVRLRLALKVLLRRFGLRCTALQGLDGGEDLLKLKTQEPREDEAG